MEKANFSWVFFDKISAMSEAEIGRDEREREFIYAGPGVILAEMVQKNSGNKLNIYSVPRNCLLNNCLTILCTFLYF